MQILSVLLLWNGTIYTLCTLLSSYPSLSGEVPWLFDTSRGRDYKILMSFQGLEMTASVQQQQRCPPTYCLQQPAVVENVSRLLTSLLLSKQLVPHLTDQCHESLTSLQSWQLLKTLYNHCNFRSLYSSVLGRDPIEQDTRKFCLAALADPR